MRTMLSSINSFSGLLVMAMARWSGSRIIYHLRVPTIGRDLIHALCLADSVIAVSDYVKRKAIEAGVPEESISVIYDTTRDIFHPYTPPGRSDVVRLLSAGRFSANKRYDLVVEALSLFPESIDYRYTIAGEPTSADERRRFDSLLRTCDRLNMRKRVDLIGFQENMQALINGHDIAVMFSTSEPLGCFAIEAMAAGRPVVVSTDGGLPEIVENGISGFIVPPNDVAGLSARLLELAHCAETRLSMGLSARSTIEKKLGMTPHVTALSGLYQYLRTAR